MRSNIPLKIDRLEIRPNKLGCVKIIAFHGVYHSVYLPFYDNIPKDFYRRRFYA